MEKALQTEIEALKKAVERDKATDMQKYRKEISEMLYMEIVSRYYHQKGLAEASLKIDPCMEYVYRLLDSNNLDEYHRILKTK